MKENDDGDDREEGESDEVVEDERGRERRRQDYSSSVSTPNSSRSSVGDREDMFGECDTLAIRVGSMSVCVTTPAC